MIHSNNYHSADDSALISIDTDELQMFLYISLPEHNHKVYMFKEACDIDVITESIDTLMKKVESGVQILTTPEYCGLYIFEDGSPFDDTSIKKTIN